MTLIRSRIVGHAEVDPAELIANPFNFRTHPTDQLQALDGSMETLGWLKETIVNTTTGHVIDGHARIERALARPGTKMPVTYVELSLEEEMLALAVLDPITEMAQRDQKVLDDLLSRVPPTDDPGLAALLADLRGPRGGLLADADEDAAPELPAEPITQPGDLCILGEHRLMCGDSTQRADVDRLMEGLKAGLVFTDPPYGVAFQSGMSKGGTATRFEQLKNDDRILDIAPVVWWAMGDDCAAFIWTSHGVYPQWRAQFADFYKQSIIWHKPGGGIGDLEGQYAVDFEMALFCAKGRPLFRGTRGMAVWTIGKDGPTSYLHPTQKPVALAQRAIMDFSDARALVLDLFGGSGSTLIACEKTGRAARVMELDPRYCDVIVRRWEDATGNKAIRP